jgi:hypothetical protein
MCRDETGCYTASGHLFISNSSHKEFLMKKHLLAIATLLVFLSGCASTNVTSDIMVKTDADPKANLSGYKSYTWLGAAAIVFDEKGQWEAPQFNVGTEIKFLIDRELRADGMSEDSVNPDLVVAYAVGFDMDSMEIKTDPENDLEVLKNVPQGALTVILVDAQTGLAVWAGVARAELQQYPTIETSKKRLDFAVSEMFSKLPR